MVSDMIILIAVVVAAALVFALTNGLHDASSVVATFIACGAGTPLQAVGLASVFGLLGALFSGSAVADTVAKIVSLPVQPSLLSVLLAALLGAVVWNLITWYLGLPSSSTHALVGGIVGAVWVSSGCEHILWGWKELIYTHQLTGLVKVFSALLISPVLGFAIAYCLQKTVSFSLKNARFAVNRRLKGLQWIMAALLAYSHGANDTQKIMGLITLALLAGNLLQQQITPEWVRLSGGMVMFAGTLFGGWSIMKTLGQGIFDIRPIHSLNAQVSSGGAIMFATVLGVPISTTHVVAGSVIGVGAADEYRMVNWNIGKEMMAAWFVTIPAAAVVGAIFYYPVIWLVGSW
ncbi:inorganic phosphate transporter [Pelotomaculum terephthalicicum JT]|uniref:inorganic phosphate transporter n=1 Tax=Pelotomaculum TaxID=191373 RepID=UPI0009CB8808|nr:MULTISPECIES: inorganic phosphate transporter [Pelotomaculum]MCG9967095.1 inorganic phosphate transporter [Pelotomaculum terephthalicicum JT]OPX87807.1 MAG: Low-affinity inorganic phosphate transporter 1 [Pelotomaculum sp. PtaB.Bin117]OPY63859.1 MAG: Low-affinity inorganic phosphate transporter 1 [Pelotomaculum sp. PtaU1.Bin065]